MLRVIFIAISLLISSAGIADDRDDRREAKREAKEARWEHREDKREAKAERRQAKAERKQVRSERQNKKWAKKSRKAKTNICDTVKDSSDPRLHGMCVSYCEARDVNLLFAEGRITAEKADRFTKRKERVLERYNATKTAADPGMPCATKQQVCPCWTSAQTSPSYWTDNSLGVACAEQDGDSIRTTEIGTPITDYTNPEYSKLQVLSISNDGVNFAHYCANEDTSTGTAMMEEISETDAIVCATQVRATCSVIGI